MVNNNGMNYKKELFKNFIIKECGKLGIDWQNFDVEEYYNPDISLTTNEKLFKNIINPKTSIMFKAEYEEKKEEFESEKRKESLENANGVFNAVMHSSNEGNGNFDDFLNIFQKSEQINITILGKRRSGKTALMFKLLEEFHKKFRCYALNYPAMNLLPKWIKKVAHSTIDYIIILDGNKYDWSLKGVKNGTVMLDEAGLLFDARMSMREEHKYLNDVLAVCRQNNNNLIFVLENSNLIDTNIIKQSDVILLKEPSFMQVHGGTEKPVIKKLYDECIDIFEELKNKNEPLEPYFFVWSEEFRGMVRFDLPACWTNKLAHAFSNR